MQTVEQALAKGASGRGAGREADIRTPPAYRSRLRRQERQTKTARLAVVLSLFLILLGAALVVGGRTFIDPYLEEAAAERQAHRSGQIVFTMPDGKFCRRLSFDNKTAELSEGPVVQCPADPATGSINRTTTFKWGAH